MSFTYFITGGNRGIGLAFVQELLARDDVKVIVSARAPEKATDLQEFAKKSGNVEIVKLDVGSQESIGELYAQVEKAAPEGIDVFIGNAGIATPLGRVVDFSPETYLEIYRVNVIGNVFTFKAIYPLLAKKKTKKVAFISSAGGSLTEFAPLPFGAYGTSKAALNYVTKSLQLDYTEEGFVFISAHPGIVDTDMSRNAGLPDEIFDTYPKITTTESAAGLIKVFDKINKDDGGKFYSYTGEETPL